MSIETSSKHQETLNAQVVKYFIPTRGEIYINAVALDLISHQGDCSTKPEK